MFFQVQGRIFALKKSVHHLNLVITQDLVRLPYPARVKEITEHTFHGLGQRKMARMIP
jgi:hypothetical protein